MEFGQFCHDELRNFANWPAEFGKFYCGKLWALMISIVQCCCNILGGGGKHATDLSPMPGNKLFGVDNIAINFINPTFDSMTKT